MKYMTIFATIVPLMVLAPSVQASVTEYTNAAAWQGAVDTYTTVDFTGYPMNTLITDQYASLGVTFTDGVDIIYPNEGLFLNDGVGINGVDSTTVVFDTDMFWIGVDVPGALQITLFNNNQLLYSSNLFGVGGTGFFAGLISSEPFDKAFIIDPLGGTVFDDLHFGAPVPGPAVLALFGVSVLVAHPRRR